MSDTPTGDSGLPPKLNLSKKISKPAEPKKLATVLKAKAPSVASPIILKAKQKTIGTPSLAPKPATASPIKVAESSESSPNTSRIKLTAKPPLKPASKTLDKASTPTLATPLNKQKTENVKPKTVLKAKQPASPATVKLKPKPSQTAVATPRPAVAKMADTAKTASAKPVTLRAKPIGLKPKTISMKPKPAMGIKRDEADTNAPMGSKRATSKIAFDNDIVNTKTIKIKPSEDVEGLTGKTPVTLNPTIRAKVPDAKRQTSRISLEAALGTEDEKQSGPKTIRLKRPTKTQTIKVSKKNDDGEALSKTAKIEMPKDDDDVPATQKATIKIKRPAKKRSVKSVSVKRKGEEQTAEAETTADAPTTSPLQPLQPLQAQSAPDTAHWTFIVSSIAALLIACVLIYVLCAQAFGPNISLTELSYGGTTELPWTGRILR